MNTGRYNFSKDYWDITMLSLQEWLTDLSPKAWKKFIDTYYLQPYVDNNYQTEVFWETHNYKYIYPKKTEDFSIFLKRVNERIEERGKFIIKQICDKLNKKISISIRKLKIWIKLNTQMSFNRSGNND